MVFFTRKKKYANAIDAGTNITGDVHSDRNWSLSGRLHGDLNVQGDVRIEAQGEVIGNITGISIWVAGKVKGNISAQQHLHLLSTCSIDGDISYRTLEIEDGAHYAGKFLADLDKPAAAVVPSSETKEATLSATKPQQDDQAAEQVQKKQAAEGQHDVTGKQDKDSAASSVPASKGKERLAMKPPVEEKGYSTKNKRIMIQ